MDMIWYRIWIWYGRYHPHMATWFRVDITTDCTVAGWPVASSPRVLEEGGSSGSSGSNGSGSTSPCGNELLLIYTPWRIHGAAIYIYHTWILWVLLGGWENGPVEIVDLPVNNGDFPYIYSYSIWLVVFRRPPTPLKNNGVSELKSLGMRKYDEIHSQLFLESHEQKFLGSKWFQTNQFPCSFEHRLPRGTPRSSKSMVFVRGDIPWLKMYTFLGCL